MIEPVELLLAIYRLDGPSEALGLRTREAFDSLSPEARTRLYEATLPDALERALADDCAGLRAELRRLDRAARELADSEVDLLRAKEARDLAHSKLLLARASRAPIAADSDFGHAAVQAVLDRQADVRRLVSGYVAFCREAIDLADSKGVNTSAFESRLSAATNI